MMIIVKKLSIVLILINLFSVSLADQYDDQYDYQEHDQDSNIHTDDDQILDLTTDSRIKTYIYNANEVYLLVLHYGFQ